MNVANAANRLCLIKCEMDNGNREAYIRNLSNYLVVVQRLLGLLVWDTFITSLMADLPISNVVYHVRDDK